MTDKTKLTLMIALMAVAVVAAFFGLGMMVGYHRGMADCPTLVETDTIVKTDTVVYNRFDTDTIVETRYVPLQVAVHDTLVDSVWVTLPYERHFFSVPDTLDLWYGGVSARIDSLRIYPHETIVTNNYVKTERKDPLLGANLGIAALYHKKQVNPCLFAEMRYNARKTTFSAFGAIDHEGRWGAGLSVSYRIALIE